MDAEQAHIRSEALRWARELSEIVYAEVSGYQPTDEVQYMADVRRVWTAIRDEVLGGTGMAHIQREGELRYVGRVTRRTLTASERVQ